MTDIKPIIEESLILNTLAESFEQPIKELAPIESGHIAKVFSFSAGDDEYVLRFTKKNMGSFKKELLIYENFAAPNIPIPPIIKSGELADLYYAISKKMSGQELSALSKEAYFNTLPSNMATLLAIHQSDVSQFEGYSWMDDNGNGLENSWEQALKRIMEEDPDDFHGNWHTLFDTVLDRAYFDSVYQKMVSLIPYCATERYLIHRDYEYNNVLAQDGKITAVLDWGQASYGDFVFDIAYLDFWRVGIDLASHFYDFYHAQGMDVSHFDERLACHTLYIGMDGLRFFGKMNNQDAISTIQAILEPYL